MHHLQGIFKGRAQYIKSCWVGLSHLAVGGRASGSFSGGSVPEVAAELDVGNGGGLLRLAAVAVLQLLLLQLRGGCLGVAEGLLGQHGAGASVVGADLALSWRRAARLGRLGQLLRTRVHVPQHVLQITSSVCQSVACIGLASA